MDATAGVVQRRVCTDTCTDQAEACGVTDRSCDAQEALEVSADQRDAEAACQQSYSKLSDSAHCDSPLACSAWQDGELTQTMQQRCSRYRSLFLHAIKTVLVVNQQILLVGISELNVCATCHVLSQAWLCEDNS